jgi:hypothetical protein
MKTTLQKHLATLAPSIAIQTIWEHDPDSRFSELTGPGCAFENEEPDDWQAWQSEIRAAAIVSGEEITGSAYLGGTWEKSGDNPAESNPEISGYENQMTVEALEELRDTAPPESVLLGDQIAAALDYLKAEARRAYDEQRAEIEAARTVEGYAVKTACGYLAHQGQTYWFEDTPAGWALFSEESGATNTLNAWRANHDTSKADPCEIVTLTH